MVDVKQGSELGGLAFNVFFEQGMCGPNLNLENVDIGIYKIGEKIQIDFYDMHCSINEENTYYKKINSLLKKIEKKSDESKTPYPIFSGFPHEQDIG